MNTLNETKLANMIYLREFLIAAISDRQRMLEELKAEITELRAQMEVKPAEKKQ